VSDRPEAAKAGEVSVNVTESVLDSIDQVFDAFGLPEPGSVLKRLAPRHVADALGFPTPDSLADGIMADIDRDLGVNHPPER
jgi:hypothetical protein